MLIRPERTSYKAKVKSVEFDGNTSFKEWDKSKHVHRQWDTSTTYIAPSTPESFSPSKLEESKVYQIYFNTTPDLYSIKKNCYEREKSAALKYLWFLSSQTRIPNHHSA